MKGQHKKQRDNELILWSNKILQELIFPNQKIILVLLSVLVICLLAVHFFSQYRESQHQSGWEELFSTLDQPPESRINHLEAMGQTRNDIAHVQATLIASQLLLADGCDQVMTNKKEALEKLERALVLFQKVTKIATDFTHKSQALFGEAQTYETLAAVRTGSKDLENSREKYKNLVDRFGNSYLASASRHRAELLARADVRKLLEQTAAHAPVSDIAEEFKITIDPTKPFDDLPTGETPKLPDLNKLFDNE